MDRFRENRRQSLQRKQPKQALSAFSLPSPQRIFNEKDKGGQHMESPLQSNRAVESILQKEVNNARKFEEVQQKLREKEVAYRHLSDLYDKANKEKQGIEISLTKQIQMYKQLSKETEVKAEERLLEVQKAFKQEMERKLFEKEEQLSRTLEEKEQLENFVNELEKIGDELELKLNHTEATLHKTEDILAKTDQQRTTLMEKLEAAEEYSKSQSDRYQGLIEKLKDDVLNTEREWRDKVDEAGKQKERALKEQEKEWKQELEKQADKFEIEKASRKQELQTIINNFETEKGRLNQQLQEKEKQIEQHHKQSKQNSDKINSAVRGYEQEIASLATEKARLFEQVDKLNAENTHLNVLIKELQVTSSSDKKNLEAYVLKLKDEINFSQTNFLRERDRNILTYEDSSKEMLSLKRELAALQAQNNALKQEATDAHMLSEEVRKLRDMLLESSYELEKCRGEFMRISKERDDKQAMKWVHYERQNGKNKKKFADGETATI